MLEINIYLAGPLFSQAEKEYNCKLKKKLSQYFKIYLPQEDGGLIINMINDGISQNNAFNKVFKWDLDAIDNCDIFLIILDGRSVDEGAVFELGYAYANKKECYGLQTDPRRLLPHGNNPMIDCALKKVFSSTEELLSWAKHYRSRKQVHTQINGLVDVTALTSH
jgi:nucleoside 2-deoxyribosyltransferase